MILRAASSRGRGSLGKIKFSLGFGIIEIDTTLKIADAVNFSTVPYVNKVKFL